MLCCLERESCSFGFNWPLVTVLGHCCFWRVSSLGGSTWHGSRGASCLSELQKKAWHRLPQVKGQSWCCERTSGKTLHKSYSKACYDKSVSLKRQKLEERSIQESKEKVKDIQKLHCLQVFWWKWYWNQKRN